MKYLTFKSFKINEGTWSLPYSEKSVDDFEEVMSSPIPVYKASDILFNLIGDDILFDEFNELEEVFGKNHDARLAVISRLKEFLDDYDKNPENTKENLSEKNYNRLRKILQQTL